jgi:small subunit ribosomal protein S1
LEILEPNYTNSFKTAHDDFDWSINKKNQTNYSKEEIKSLDEQYANSLKTFEDNDIVEAEVVGITKSDVIMSLGSKSDGMIPLSEFRDIEEIALGQRYQVYVVSKEDRNGHLLLSRKNASILISWEKIKEAHQNETIVTGLITSKTKGGLIVKVFDLETFLPGSQIDVKPITDYDQYVGKTMDLKVVKINELIKNAVVSHKAIIEADIEDQRAEIIGKLERGQIMEGVIKNITDFGAFLDLGGIDGLLYITDISWGRINHPSEVLSLNEKINVVILDFDDTKKRISLGLKQLTAHPWESMGDKLNVGEIVKGKVVNVEDYGVFLEIQPGVEGLIHVSEVTWSNQPINSKEFFKIGDTHEAKIITVDVEERKMSLSIKQLQEDPWDKLTEQFKIGSKHKGIVKHITNYGLFIELADSMGGMMRISDLSWVKKFNHPSEFAKVGDELDVVILEVDSERRKISLGHKQLESDPWDTYESDYRAGTIHKGEVIKKDEKGFEVMFEGFLQAFSPNKHARLENGENVEVGNSYDFKILEFDKSDRKIMVSHSKIWEEAKSEEIYKEKADKKAEIEQTKKSVKKINQSIDKSTLGDLDALQQLKEKMNNNDENE